MNIDMAALTLRFETSLREVRDYVLKNPAFGSLAYKKTDKDVKATGTFVRQRFEPDIDDEDISELMRGFVLALRGAGANPSKIALVGFKVIKDEIDVVLVAPGEEVDGPRMGGVSAWGAWERVDPEESMSMQTPRESAIPPFKEGCVPNPKLQSTYEREDDLKSKYSG
jgi:hypothetical protein